MNKNTPSGKGLRTAYQAVVGAIVTFVTGLWALPEVREYTSNFVSEHGLVLVATVLVALGISSGLIAWVQNRFGDVVLGWILGLIKK